MNGIRILAALVLLAPVIGTAQEPGAVVSIREHLYRIRLLDDKPKITITSPTAIEAQTSHAPNGQRWAAGTYTFSLESGTPDRQVFHLFTKTFKPTERAELDAYLTEWQGKGYQPEPRMRGQRLRTESSHELDTRIIWVSMLRSPDAATAERDKERLAADGAWAWIRPETVSQGEGQVLVSSGAKSLRVTTPIHLESVKLVVGEKGGQSYAGALEIDVDASGRLQLVERVGLEDYLTCVLPSEMPAKWPADALKAQAIAARTEVLAHLGLKHEMEGFSFTDTELSRAYRGQGQRHPRSDTAVIETRGQVALAGGRLIPAVFSATCGGYTENNDTVWAGPADAALRGLADNRAAIRPASQGWDRWLRGTPTAYCGGDARHYRWKRRFAVKELSDHVNKRYNVGRVRQIELGERGVSGRLKNVRVVGTTSTVTIEKELPIRLAFGSLPSAMFIIDISGGPSNPQAFTFVGGGRGHGVGLCQNGARGMALEGIPYDRILTHYFTGARVVTIR